MAGEAKLIIRSRAGVKKGELIGDATSSGTNGGYWTAACHRVVNSPGLLTWTMDARNRLVAGLETNDQVELWRRDLELGIAWYPEFDGLYRGIEQETTTGKDTFTGTAIDPKAILGWRHAFYKTAVANRTAFGATAAESIMKLLIQYNLTASGTTGDGRIRNATSAGLVNGLTIAIQADAAGGTVTAWNCAQDNLLETLQKLALIGGGDFDLVKTGVATYEFRFYPGQRGTDRSATITFSTTYDNMVNPRYTYNRLQEKTVVIVGGMGREQYRDFAIVAGPDHDAATNDIETFVQATNTAAAGLDAVGNKAANERRAQRLFSFGVRQASKYYARDYYLGDLVRANYLDLSMVLKVEEAGLSYDGSGAEKIDIRLRTLP